MIRAFSPGSSIAYDIGSPLVTTDQIQSRISEIGAEISKDYAGKRPILVGALKGVTYFMSDLLRAITIPVEVDYISISSYSTDSRHRRGLVRIVKDMDIQPAGRHVIFVEDMIDTGLTLNYILRTLRLRQPASLEVCALFDKPVHRLIETRCKYKGFSLPNLMVVGYGLDYHERYRNLSFIAPLKPRAFEGETPQL